MSGVTWSKFYWSDWASDPKLKLCSLAGQGLWMQLLCLAAQNDPIGYLSVAGRPLGVTDLARLIGASETELGDCLSELERNGVFSRDRTGRIYSRRMVTDARKSAEAVKNGKLGGNPSLGNSGGKPPGVKGSVKGGHKPHKPLASSKVEGPDSPSNLGQAKNDFSGPKEVRDAFLAKMDDDWVRAYVDPCGWQDVPERALIPLTRYAGTKIRNDARSVLIALSVVVLERAA